MPTQFGNTIIPFGKHKGEQLNDIDFGYIDYLLRQFESEEDWTTRYSEFFEALMEYVNEPNIRRERDNFDLGEGNELDDDEDDN